MQSPSESLPLPAKRSAPERRRFTLNVTSGRTRLRLFLAGCLLLACISLAATRYYNANPGKDALLPSVVYYHRVKKGMSREAVEHVCGPPEYVQQNSYFEDGASEWYYSASDGQIQINFDNDTVKRISRE